MVLSYSIWIQPRLLVWVLQFLWNGGQGVGREKKQIKTYSEIREHQNSAFVVCYYFEISIEEKSRCLSKEDALEASPIMCIVVPVRKLNELFLRWLKAMNLESLKDSLNSSYCGSSR